MSRGPPVVTLAGVPRTRHDVEREEKKSEILDAAERQLMEGGVSALSVAAIARELGVAQNAVYWYFTSRDELFVATLERVLRRVLHRKPPHSAGMIGIIIWFVDRLAEFEPLMAAMNDRARTSPVVADFRDELHRQLRSMLVGAIQGSVLPGELDTTADVFVAAVEGVLVQGLSRRERTRVLRFLLGKLLRQRSGAAS